jgi:predicted PurR-regulated permease PerM
MSTGPTRTSPATYGQSVVVDIAIRLAFVGLLAYWSLILIGPFIIVGLWGVILAVALYPTFVWLRKWLGGRGSPAAALLTIALLIIVFGPASLLATALIENLHQLAGRIAEGTLQVPPPAAKVQDWPIIGKNLYQSWYLASTNLGEALDHLGPQVRPVARFLLSAAASAGIGALQLVAAVIIAAFLFVPAERLVTGIRAFATRVVARQGDRFVTLAGSTIRNVARGVIGISLLQSLLIGIGLLAAGFPGAGLVTVGTLVLGILQIGPGILVLPTIIWAWLTLDAVYALMFTAYMVPVTLLDNFLKPIVMAQGLPTPMLVIFIGVIGGTLAHGLIGLFVGPIVLAVGYELLLLWVAGQSPVEAPRAGDEVQVAVSTKPSGA